MSMTYPDEVARAFKTAWFAKAARKARIGDDELCEAIQEVMEGQADDLGGGVFKKRVNAPPPKGGGFRLRLKAGSVRHSADRCTIR